MHDIYMHAAERLGTSEELVRAFWENYTYTIAELQIWEARHALGKMYNGYRPAKLKIYFKGIGTLSFMQFRIKNEKTKYNESTFNFYNRYFYGRLRKNQTDIDKDNNNSTCL